MGNAHTRQLITQVADETVRVIGAERGVALAPDGVSLGEIDLETPDAQHTKYILNFDANFYEAHQGPIHVAKRVIKGRFDNGAKLVTFDVRLSNTAGRSDSTRPA